MSTVGWERLVTISDAELRGSSEDTVDELYAFLLTNKLQPTSELVQQSGHLVKLISTIQTVLRVGLINLLSLYNRLYTKELYVLENLRLLVNLLVLVVSLLL